MLLRLEPPLRQRVAPSSRAPILAPMTWERVAAGRGRDRRAPRRLQHLRLSRPRAGQGGAGARRARLAAGREG